MGRTPGKNKGKELSDIRNEQVKHEESPEISKPKGQESLEKFQ